MRRLAGFSDLSALSALGGMAQRGAGGAQSTHSLNFAPSGSYVALGSGFAGTLNGSAWTLAFWLKLTTGAGTKRVILGAENATNCRMVVYQWGGVGDDTLYCGQENVSVGASISFPFATYGNAWTHVAWVWTGSAPLVAYVNGSAVALSGGGTFAFSSSYAGPYNFSDDTNPSHGLPGLLDDFALAPSVLSAGQIAGLAAGTLNPVTLTLTGLWRLEEGTGTTTADSSGHGNTGTLTNGPTWSADVPAQLQ